MGLDLPDISDGRTSLDRAVLAAIRDLPGTFVKSVRVVERVAAAFSERPPEDIYTALLRLARP